MKHELKTLQLAAGEPSPVAIFLLLAYHSSMSSWYLYIIRCKDSSLYTGIATDIDRRIAQHNAGKGAAYTRGRRPVQLALREGPLTESAARKCEAAIKKLSRDEKEAFIEHRRMRYHASNNL